MIVCITASGKFTDKAVQDLITDFFAPYAGKDIEVSSEEHKVLQAANLYMPVYDLAKGLFPVDMADLDETQMPLAGSESHAETLSHTTGYDEVGQGTEGFRIDLRDLGLSAYQQGEIERRIMHAIRIKEEFTPYRNGTRVLTDEEVKEMLGIDPLPENDRSKPLVIEEGEVSITLPAADPEKIRCYKSKRGNIRKAGKSKARPGETEIWLSEEEISRQ